MGRMIELHNTLINFMIPNRKNLGMGDLPYNDSYIQGLISHEKDKENGNGDKYDQSPIGEILKNNNKQTTLESFIKSLGSNFTKEEKEKLMGFLENKEIINLGKGLTKIGGSLFNSKNPVDKEKLFREAMIKRNILQESERAFFDMEKDELKTSLELEELKRPREVAVKHTVTVPEGGGVAEKPVSKIFERAMFGTNKVIGGGSSFLAFVMAFSGATVSIEETKTPEQQIYEQAQDGVEKNVTCKLDPKCKESLKEIEKSSIIQS